MRRNISSLIITIIMFMLTASASGSVLTHKLRDDNTYSITGPIVRSVINSDLQNLMDDWDDDTEVNILVRFRGDSVLFDEELFENMGFHMTASFHVVPALALEGPASAIANLASLPFVDWIENDTRVELMMEVSLQTINATNVWDTRVMEEGIYHRDDQIDGSGITVVILDTGIDADHPDLDYGEKTIVNLKSDVPGGPWHERINTDTSYGHGTHCAGTVAGNGDASAGARRGVAPGANLIGLSVGDIGITLTNVLGGLEWVYENSQPNNNLYNIRVVSNSWGTSGRKWDPQDTISQVCYKLADENNVVCVFAAGNDGGNNHDGQEITTSPYANTPVNIAVAALERDGSAMASFSSRGQSDLIETWPDVGAPGVKIWSSHARKTVISAIDKMRGDNPNPYYLAISGTSMATPHASGLAALMFQACPSLGMSEVREDWSGTEEYGDIDWASAPETRIHEIEEIMELSTMFLDTGEGVPNLETPVRGTNGRSLDFAQGYGLIKCDTAVGICLTLQKMRERYPDRIISVEDAYRVFNEQEISYQSELDEYSPDFTAQWEGEYSRWNDMQQSGLLDTQNQSKYVYVPVSTTHVRFVMTYQVTSLDDLQAGDLSYAIDIGPDGRKNFVGTFGFRMQGKKELNVDVDGDKVGTIWKIDITGQGLKVPITAFNLDRSYVEIRVEYDASLSISGDADGGNGTAPFPLINSSYEPYMVNFYPVDEMARPNPPGATASKTKVFVFDLDRADFPVAEPQFIEEEWDWWPLIVVAAAAVIIISVLLIRRRIVKNRPSRKKNAVSENE
ncbi:MAG: S8 family serine peptidase [Candidatus Thermoplasmatota archaeon]|nr:S8 family serine peptidase [Candidatus Thermoplasmatota archaeon]